MKAKTLDSRVSCAWFKLYPEQFGSLPCVAGATFDENGVQAAVMEKKLREIVNDPDCPFWADSIVHKRDRVVDIKDVEDEQKLFEAIVAETLEKVHAHILVMPKGCKLDGHGNTRPKTVRMRTIVDYFADHDIHIIARPEDATLFAQSTKTPDMRKYEHVRAIVYHTHDTDDAIKDGKQPYPREAHITNLPQTYIDWCYSKYDTLTAKLTPLDRELICEEAMEVGRRGGDFAEFWFAQRSIVTMNAQLKKIAQEYWEKGTNDFMTGDASRLNVRCCIHINGLPNVGKTYTSKATLSKLGLQTYAIESGKSGKFDDLKSSHGAIVVSDTGFGDIHAMTDNSFCRAYRRNNGNPIWAGKYLIVTYNGTLDDYIDAFYPDTWAKNEESRNAIKSRFFECECDEEGLHVISYSTRGGKEEVTKRAQLFKTFLDAFQECHANYNPSSFDATALIESIIGNHIESEEKEEEPTRITAQMLVKEETTETTETNEERAINDYDRRVGFSFWKLIDRLGVSHCDMRLAKWIEPLAKHTLTFADFASIETELRQMPLIE